LSVWPPAFSLKGGALDERLDTLFTAPPLPSRRQNGGDYTIPELGLRDDICPGRAGFGIHLAQR